MSEVKIDFLYCVSADINPLTMNDNYSRHQNSAACYQSTIYNTWRQFSGFFYIQKKTLYVSSGVIATLSALCGFAYFFPIKGTVRPILGKDLCESHN